MKAKITKRDGTTIELEGSLDELSWIINPPLPLPVLIPNVFDSFVFCMHEYPDNWLGTTAAPCKKCGSQTGIPSTFTRTSIGQQSS